MVASLDPLRGSRGFSIGWTGCQCLSKRNNNPAASVMGRGTLRYTDFACRLSELVKRMCEIAGFEEPFLGGDPLYTNRWEEYAACISPGNILESISFKCYIHELGWVGGGSDRLNIHVNSENCPEEGWNGCGVAYGDNFSPPLGRWITMVAIGTSRKSVSDSEEGGGSSGTSVQEHPSVQTRDHQPQLLSRCLPSGSQESAYSLPSHCAPFSLFGIYN